MKSFYKTILIVTLLLAIPTPCQAATRGDPAKPPVSLVRDGTTEVCVGGTLSVEKLNESRLRYVKLNGKIIVDNQYTSLIVFNNMQTSDSGTWEVGRWSDKSDKWNVASYNVQVLPHNIGANGKCTRCGREQGPAYTITLTAPNGYGYLNSFGDDIFIHQDDRLTHSATYGHNNLYVKDVGSLYIEICSRTEPEYYKNYTGPLIFDKVGVFPYETHHHVCKKDEHTSWSDDWGNMRVTAHEYVNGTCIICGKVNHVHAYNTFVSYVTAPTCTASGTATYKCSCGQTTTKSVGALGHAWPSNWNGNDATNHFKNCTRCSTRLQTAAHTWAGNGSVASTCTGTGYNDYKCSACGRTRRDTVAALGHNFQWKWYTLDGVAKAYKQLTCTRCNTLSGDRVYNTYTVTYKTVDKDNGTELASETKTKSFGDSARGNELGTGNVAYNNIPYKYHSDTAVTVKGACTVTRYMQKYSYIVHFNANSGTGSMGDLTYLFDATNALPENTFTKTGYTFMGWSKTQTGSKLYNDKQSVSNIMARTEAGNNVTLYAVWQANKYTVSFDAAPVAYPADIIVTFDSVYGTLPSPQQDGYIFKGWVYLEDTEPISTPISSTTVVYLPNNHTLSAIWEANAVNVTYVSPSKSQVVECLQGFTTNAPFIPNEDGLTFKYWSTSENGAQFDFNTAINQDTTLYAVFEGKDITITLPGAGEAERTYPAQFGELPTPEQPGKEFDGWYYDEDLTQPVKPTDKVPTDDVTLYPKYTTSVYKLTLKERSESWDIKYSETIPTLPTPTQTNKVFKYWAFENKQVKSGDTYQWSKSIQLEPIWEQKICVVVLPDGSVREIASGSTIGTLPTAPDKLGQDFNGYVDQFKNPVSSSTVVTEDMVIQYDYRSRNVTLTLVDGDWNTKLAYETGVALTGLPTRSKGGFLFKGWSLSETGAVTNSPVYGDTTLYAIYEAGAQDIYLADLAQTVQKKTGTPIGALPAANKDGYDFIGWEYNGQLITSETLVPTGGMTLHARYEQVVIDKSNTVEIRYWSDGVKINTVDLPKGETLWDPGAPALNTVDNRKFMFWSIREGGTMYEFGKRVNTDIDLYAQWK